MRNCFILAVTTFLFLSSLAYSGEIRTIENTDLNGDGKIDKIEYEFMEEDGCSNICILNIHGLSTSIEGENFNQEIKIVDIDTKDNIKEIAIPEVGPSDDYATTFCYYNGRSIIEMGKLQGTDDLKIDGSGCIISPTRAMIVQTWFFNNPYCLNKEHLLEEVQQGLYYPAYKYGLKLKVKKSFPIRKSRDIDSATITLKVGEEIELIAHDNKKWVQIRTASGINGWFAVQNFDVLEGTGGRISDYLDGLCYAD